MAEKLKKVSRGMPNNVEAEASLLGSALIDNKAADLVIPILRKEDFYLSNNREIFEVMKLLQESGKPIDTVSVADMLEIKGKLNEIGVTYLSDLANCVPSAANCEHYAGIIKRDSLTRKVIEAGNDIAKFGYECEDGSSALSNAERLVYQIAEANSQKALVKADDALAAALQGIQDAQAGNVPKNVINTGFKTLDSYTKGLKPGEMVLLAARPSVGKTAFALNIAANACLLNGKTVAIFSLEMPSALLVKRMLSYVSKVSLNRMGIRGALTPADQAKIFMAYNALLAANLYIDDYSLNTPSDVLSKCRRLKREVGLDMIIIDYLQLMTGGSNGGRSPESRQVEVSEMSRKMKIYSSELGVPIMLLSQMSRGIEQRKENNHLPLLSDLRESGSIEQDADIVMFLHNPSKYNAALPENEIILDIKKNRNGPIGEIKLEWNGDTTSFSESTSTDVAATQETTPVAKKPIIEKSAPKDTTLKEVESDNLPFAVNETDSGLSNFNKENLNAVLEAEDGKLYFDEDAEEFNAAYEEASADTEYEAPDDERDGENANIPF